jgi:hypothetical protein
VDPQHWISELCTKGWILKLYKEFHTPLISCFFSNILAKLQLLFSYMCYNQQTVKFYLSRCLFLTSACSSLSQHISPSVKYQLLSHLPFFSSTHSLIFHCLLFTDTSNIFVIYLCNYFL